MSPKVLFVNYTDETLVSELSKKGYTITTVKHSSSSFNPAPYANTFDLIYFAKFTPPRYDDIQILLHEHQIPIIYGFHTPCIIYKPYRATNYFDNLVSLAKLVQMKLVNSVSGLHVLNKDEFRTLGFLGLTCHYVPLGVDTYTFRPLEKNNRFTIVFVSPRYQKGVDMLINIVPLVLKRAPTIQFKLTGNGFLGKYFYTLKKAYPNNVEVCERLPNDQFTKLFSSSHLLLFPSRFESFGIVVLEAISSGMPVVCYDIAGASRDIVKRHGVGVVAKPFALSEIATGIFKYYQLWLKDTEAFENVSSFCRETALKYDWAKSSSLFDAMFKRTLNA